MIQLIGQIIRKQYEIFHTVNDAVRVQKPEGQGISPYDQWRKSQPGFYKLENGSFQTALDWQASKRREIFWDGTFNMPIMPLTDTSHKDAKHIFRIA